MPPSLGRAEGMQGRREARGRLHRSGCDEHLTAAHLFTAHPAQQHRGVVAGLHLRQRLAEGLQSGGDRPDGGAQAHELDGAAERQHATFDSSGDDRASSADGQRALHRHEERPVEHAWGHRHRFVDGPQERVDGLDPPRFSGERTGGRHRHDGQCVAREPVPGHQLPQLQLDQLEQLGVAHEVGLVERDDEVRHAHPAREQHVLTGLWHRPVLRRYDEDGTVDLGRAGDHVLDVVGVTRHVDMGVMPCRRFVFDVRDADGDAPLQFLGCLVDPVEGHEPVVRGVGVGEHFGDRGGERGLAVVDMAHRADVEVRLGAGEGGLAHDGSRLSGVGVARRRSATGRRRTGSGRPNGVAAAKRR